MKSKAKPVVVTTEHRGVFFGYLTGPSDGTTLRLSRARLCVYWSAAMKGFMGLASIGPDKDCKIGPEAEIELRAITAVLDVTPEAEARWLAAPWGK